MGSQASPTEADWDVQKGTVRRLYLVKRLKRLEVIKVLMKRGFCVTPRQFDTQMTKWEFRQNISESAWRFVGHRIKKRKVQDKDTEVLVSGVRFPKEKVVSLVRRHEQLLPMAHSPVLEPGMPVVVQTPIVVDGFPWPTMLPWLEFRRGSLEFFRGVRILDVHSQHALGAKGFTDLTRLMPSFDEPDCVGHLSVSPYAGSPAFELMQSCIFSFSNGDSDKEDDFWEAFVLMVLRIRPTRLPILRAPHQLTILSFLHRVLFKVIRELFGLHRTAEQRVRRSERRKTHLSILKWILACGIDPATPIMIDEIHVPKAATLLQIAAFVRSQDVLMLLLDAGADPQAEIHLQGPNVIEQSPLELALSLCQSMTGSIGVQEFLRRRPVEGVLALLLKPGGRIATSRKEHQLKAAIQAGFMTVAQQLVERGTSWCFNLPSDNREGVGAETAFTAAARLQLYNYNTTPRPAEFTQSEQSPPYVTSSALGLDIDDTGDDISEVEDLEDQWEECVTCHDYGEDDNRPCEDCGSTQTQVQERIILILEYLLNLLGHEKTVSQQSGCWRPSDVAVIAARRGFNRVLQWLRDQGVDLECANSQGVTPWLAALGESRRSTCRFLCETGALAGAYGPIALRMTLWTKHSKILEDLLAAGVNLETPPDAELFSNVVHHWGFGENDAQIILSTTRVLDIALQERHREACWMLIHAGAQISSGVLSLAAEENDAELAELALKADVDVTQVDIKRQLTPLQIAVIAGSFSIVRLLLERGADVNASGTAERLTPLQLAVRHCSLPIVPILLEYGAIPYGDELFWAMRTWCVAETEWVTRTSLNVLSTLVDYGANPHLKSADGETCFELALQERDARVVKWASDYWPREYDPGVLCAAVVWALRTSDDQYVRLLLNLRPLGQMTSVMEATVVALATHHPSPGPSTCDQRIRELLLAQIPPSAHCYISHFLKEELERKIWQDRHFNGMVALNYIRTVPNRLWRLSDSATASPLTAAILCGDSRCWNRLLEHGFYPDQYALACAIRLRRSDIVSKFLDIGVPIQEPHRLSSPVLLAVCVGCCKILSLLLQNGYGVDDRYSHEHPTPLQEAIKRNSHALIKMLLDEEPDVSARPAPERGGTALQFAAIQNQLDLVRELIEKGSVENINAHRAPFEGRTALEGAAEQGRLDVVKFLLSYGAKTTGSGQRQYLRAIKFAESEKHVAVSKLLKNHRQWTNQDQIRWKEDEELMEEDCPETDADDDYPVSECSDDDCTYKHFPSFWKRRVHNFPDDNSECFQEAEDTFFSEAWPMIGAEENRGEVLMEVGSLGSSLHRSTDAHTAADGDYRDDTEPWTYNYPEADEYLSFLEYESLMMKDH